jgi:hypothetical protein
MMASVIVHEGVHYFGLGELSAHIAEAKFLLKRFANSLARVDPTAPLTKAQMPHIISANVALVNAYRKNDIVALLSYLKRAGYTPQTIRYRNPYGVDSFVDAVPLRTGVPAVDKYLSVPMSSGERI